MSVNTNICYLYLNSVETWLDDIRREVHYYEIDKQIQVSSLPKMTTESDTNRESPYVNIWECLGEKNSPESDEKSVSESLEHLSENSNYVSESSVSSSTENIRAESENNLNILKQNDNLCKITNSEPNVFKSSRRDNTVLSLNKHKNLNSLPTKHADKMIRVTERNMFITSSPNICNKISNKVLFDNSSLPDLSHTGKNINLSKENSIEFVSIDTVDNCSDYTDKNQHSNYLESIESLIDNLFDFEDSVCEENKSFIKDDEFLSVNSDLDDVSLNSNILVSDNEDRISYISKKDMENNMLDNFHTNNEFVVKLRTKYHSNKPIYEEKMLRTFSLPNVNRSFSINTPLVNRKSHRHAQILLEVPSFTIKSTKDLTNFDDQSLSYAKENSNSEMFEKGSVQTLQSLNVVTANVNVKQEEDLSEFLRENIVFWIREELRFGCEEEEEFVVMEQQELLKSIHQFPSKCERPPPQISKFPLPDDSSVEFRKKPAVRTARCSKTLDLGKSQLISHQRDTKNFEVRGLVKFQMPDKTIITKLNQDYIVYENGTFYMESTKRLSRDLLKKNVIIKSIKYLNKNKEVQLIDAQNLTYVIYFDSPKYAKQFMDNDVIQGYVMGNSPNASTIKKRLLGFLGRRSTREDLEKIGIIKNEPIFGNTLSAIYQKNGAKFIYRVIELIERPENMKSLGLYRTSGNLAMIQKIRFQVDNGKLDILDQYARDPDVLTGSLKLFFRELKEPLISMEVCEQLLGFARKDPLKLTPQDLSKINSVLSKSLHQANRETLFVLIRHLLNVVANKQDNKMDTYNLSVCWGPSIVFQAITSPIAPEKTFDLVMQSQDAMKLVEFLLSFYKTYPEELPPLGTASDSLNIKLNCIKPQDYSSKESLDSFHTCRSPSTQNLNIDDVVKKAIDLIDPHLPCDGLYTKISSPDKASKILKKLSKKKDTDTEKHKMEIAEVGEALKKYLRDSQDWLVTKVVFERVLAASKDYHGLYMDPYTRDKITTAIETLPKKDTFIFLTRHLAKVIEDKTMPKSKKDELYQIWTRVLNHQQRITNIEENFTKFLQVCIKIFDPNTNNNLPDLVPHAELLKDLKTEQEARKASLNRKKTQSVNQRVSESDRFSKYDDLDDFHVGEAQFLDVDVQQKTEDTKL